MPAGSLPRPSGGSSLVGRAYGLEQARSLDQPLRLLLGRRHPCASPARGGRAVPAGDHRRHARRQKGTCRAHRRRARERAIVERAPPRPQTAGALGFWQAAEEGWPRTRGQRCWVHKTANVLNKLPKSQQSKAKRALQEIWMAETKK